MCMLGLSLPIKGKIISYYPDSGYVMYKLLFNPAILPHIQNSQQKTFKLLFYRCHPMGNFRKFENFQANHFVPSWKGRKSKINTNSKTAETNFYSYIQKYYYWCSGTTVPLLFTCSVLCFCLVASLCFWCFWCFWCVQNLSVKKKSLKLP